MTKSKSKKRKVAHSASKPYSKPTRNDSENLTHEEIWDDSALQRSWDDAVAEYEFYHSIHAKGEDVDEVLKQYHATTAAGGTDMHETNNDGDENEEGEVSEDGEIDDGDGEVDEVEYPIDSTKPVLGATQATPDLPSTTPAQPQTQTSHALNQDQALENIKMAYYWAGYYSALYDSQRQATNTGAATEEQHHDPATAHVPNGTGTVRPDAA